MEATASGDGATQLTDTPVDEGQPAWRPVKVFDLVVRREGSGRGVVRGSPAGITCGRDCREAYAAGTLVKLTATPAPDSSFYAWGGACQRFGLSRTCWVRMNGSRVATATFISAG